MKSNYELKSEAYNLLSKDWGNAIGVTFILFCVSIAASLIPYAGDAIGIIIAGPLAFGTALFFLKVSKGEKGEIEDLFHAFKSKEAFSFSLIAYLFTLIIIIPVFVVCIIIWVTLFVGDFENIASLINSGTASLIENGTTAPYSMDPSFLTEYSSPLFDSGIGTIIFSALIIIFIPITIVSLLLSQVYFILADQKTISGFRAIEMSWNVMKGKKMKLFLLQLSFIGWAILSVFTFFIGLLFLYPYMLTTYAKFYQNLYD
jgi:uncharacterized membrane protein